MKALSAFSIGVAVLLIDTTYPLSFGGTSSPQKPGRLKVETYELLKGGFQKQHFSLVGHLFNHLVGQWHWKRHTNKWAHYTREDSPVVNDGRVGFFPGGNGGMLIAETSQGAQMMPFQLHEQEWNNRLIKNAHHPEFVCVFWVVIF